MRIETMALIEEDAHFMVSHLSGTLCSIRIVTPDGEFLRRVYCCTSEDNEKRRALEMEDFAPISEKTVCGCAILFGEVQRVPDMSKDPRFGNPRVFENGRYNVCVSIQSEKRTVVISVYSKDEEFTEEEEGIISLLANNIENAILLERAMEEIALMKANAEIGKNMNAIAHEVRNPVTQTLGVLRRLKKKNHIPKGELELVDLIINSGTVVEKTLENMLKCSCPYKPQKEKVDAVQKIKDLKDNLITVNDRDIYFLFEKDLSEKVFMEWNRIEGVIRELLENAKANSPEESSIGVGVKKTSINDMDYLCIFVVSQGEMLLESPFELFETTKSSGGLGLASAKKVVEAHNGIIDFETGDGTVTFNVKLPF
ncbi:ATP-binding protein [Patescibacteria group bacterium]